MKPNWKHWTWWTSRLLEGTVAIALFYVSINLIEYRDAVQREDVPAEDWFVVNEIYVPDHPAGSDPMMVYDRDILSTHKGFWVVEAQIVEPAGRVGVFQNACSGSGTDEYDVNEVLSPNHEVKWSWFFGRPCTIPPGTYRILLSKDMTIPGYPVKSMKKTSNTFHVTE